MADGAKRVTMQVCGAARTVTGMQLLFQTESATFLVDCGLFQGPKTLKSLNYEPFAITPSKVDFLALTHAHIDHSGLIPKLVREGFGGPIYATRGTTDLAGCLLPDSGHIQEMEVQQLNRRNARRGRDHVTPIYTVADATAALAAFKPVDYQRWIEPAAGIRLRYWNAGHILGSASIEIEFAGAGEAGKALRVLVSGDIGPDAGSLQPDPEAAAGFDWVVCESTYGDTDRPASTPDSRRQTLAAAVRDAVRPNGALLIPCFAVERTQELIVDLVKLMQAGAIPKLPVFVDSPLAIRATEAFLANAGDLDIGVDLRHVLGAPELHFTETADQSRAIEQVTSFHIVIAASGMCDAGRIRHHLKRWLWHRDCTVLMVGFQAEGTLGRLLEDGAKAVRIQGDEVHVKARIRRIDDYSGHADAPELERWLEARRPIRRGVFLVHGEETGMAGLARRIGDRLVPAAAVHRPELDETVDLISGRSIASSAAPRRAEPATVGRLDWHNDLSRLLLDISEGVEQAADDRGRGVLIRKLRRALADDGG